MKPMKLSQNAFSMAYFEFMWPIITVDMICIVIEFGEYGYFRLNIIQQNS